MHAVSQSVGEGCGVLWVKTYESLVSPAAWQYEV